METILNAAKKLQGDLILLRRELHQNAEVGFDLSNTLSIIRTELEKLGLQPKKVGRAVISVTIGKKQGKTIVDALDELYATYGYYLAHVQSIELTGADAMDKAARMMSDLREAVPTTIGGAIVTAVRDYRESTDTDLRTGKVGKIASAA